MTTQKPIIVDGGVNKRLADADTLIVGAGIDAATGTTLTIGGTTATSITLGSVTIPVNIPGDVTTLGGTTFQTNATFEGDVTFGVAPADTATFAATTTVVFSSMTAGSILFAGTSGTLSQNNANLFWDNTNSRLGIGTVSPATAIELASGQLAVPTGSASAPSIAIRGDLNNGIYSPGTDQLAITTAGTQRVVVDAIGAVGINQPSPTATLDVGGSSRFTNAGNVTTTIQSSGPATSGQLIVRNSSGSAQGTVSARGSAFAGTTFGVALADVIDLTVASAAAFLCGTTDAAPLVLGTNNAERLRISATGNVSVGTTGATQTFNVGTGAASNFAVSSDGRIHTYGTAAPANGELLIGDGTNGYFTKATLTAGSGITITNAAGAVTIAATGGGGGGSTDLTLITTGLTAGDTCYVTSTNDTTAAANATAVSTSNAIGIVVTVGGAGTGKVRAQGTYTAANFITGLTLVSGQTAYLSKTNGKLTNDVSAYTTGNVYVPVGTITNVITAAGGDGAADVAVNLGFSIVV